MSCAPAAAAQQCRPVASLDLNQQHLTSRARGKRKADETLVIPATLASAPAPALQVFTGDILHRLADHMKACQFDVVVGCVAWTTHPDVVRQWAQRAPKPHVSLLVQKEHFLRRKEAGSKAGFDYGAFLQQMYGDLEPLDVRRLAEHQAGHLLPRVDLHTAGGEPLGAVRCVGYAPTVRKPNKSGPSDKAIPKMHHKFLVFGRWTDARRVAFRPVAGWLGSLNLTRNGQASRDSGIWLDASATTQSALETLVHEWECMLALSESLQWKKPGVSPEFHALPLATAMGNKAPAAETAVAVAIDVDTTALPGKRRKACTSP
jgi:hypothetical protein